MEGGTDRPRSGSGGAFARRAGERPRAPVEHPSPQGVGHRGGHRAMAAGSPVPLSKAGRDCPASGSSNGKTGNRRSPETRGRVRLVAKAVSPGQLASRAATCGAALITCSTLSRTSSSRLLCRRVASISATRWLARSCRPSACAMAGRTWSGSVIAARGTKAMPSRDAAPSRPRFAAPGASCQRRPGRPTSASARHLRRASRAPPQPRRRGQLAKPKGRAIGPWRDALMLRGAARNAP